MFRKVTLTLLAAVLVAGTVTAVPASAAGKISNGVACSKAGAKTKVAGYSYQCAKNTLVKNSKLTWLSVECLSAIKSYDAAVKAKADLSNVAAQAADLDAQLATANDALTKTSAALDAAKAQINKSRATLTTTTNPAEKQALAAAVTKLANAILVLTASRAKLDTQVKDLISKKALLASAPDQLNANVTDSKASASLLCAKGF
jgi:membrane-associated HD superfamily phosphohydrolase